MWGAVDAARRYFLIPKTSGAVAPGAISPGIDLTTANKEAPGGGGRRRRPPRGVFFGGARDVRRRRAGADYSGSLHHDSN